MRLALRKLIFNACVLLGLLGGLHAGMTERTPRVHCSPAAPQCVSQTALAGPSQMIETVIVGVLIGVAGGAGLALLIPLRPKRIAAANEALPGGRWITARYEGRCRRCGQTIYPGDRVMHFRVDRKVACRPCALG
jgi:hypothetical protein